MVLPARLPLLLAVVLVTACSAPGIATSPCNQGVCKATVTVQSCTSGQLTVTPDPISVSEPNNMEWTIATAGFIFSQDGIVVPGAGFTNAHSTGNGKKFIVHNAHTDLGMIKYTVRVVQEQGGVACAPLDPFIHNH